MRKRKDIQDSRKKRLGKTSLIGGKVKAGGRPLRGHMGFLNQITETKGDLLE